MFDDRLEIYSPGALPNLVTVENMKQTRYSRNPLIARTLVEFGWVRELNEGVNRIYQEMNDLSLKAPEFSEPSKTGVKLILRNKDTKEMSIPTEQNFTERELLILKYLYDEKTITAQKGVEVLGIQRKTVGRLLKSMVGKDILIWNGSHIKDPNQFYEINENTMSKDFLLKILFEN